MRFHTLGAGVVIVVLYVVKCHATEAEDATRPYEFGFHVEGYQHRQERKDEKGIIMGEFGFVTGDGIYHITVYATDENGDFKIIKMENKYIGLPNEDEKMNASEEGILMPIKVTEMTTNELEGKKPEGIAGCGGCIIPVKPESEESNPELMTGMEEMMKVKEPQHGSVDSMMPVVMKPSEEPVMVEEEKPMMMDHEKPMMMHHEKPMMMHHEKPMDHEKPMIMHHEKPMMMENEKPTMMHHEKPMMMHHEQPMMMENEKPLTMENEKPMMMDHEKPMMMEHEKPMMEHEKPMMMEHEKPMMEHEKPMMMEHEKPMMMEHEKPMMMHHGKPMIMHHGKPMMMHHGKPLMMHHEKPMMVHHGKPFMHHGKPMMMHHEKPMMMHQEEPMEHHQALTNPMEPAPFMLTSAGADEEGVEPSTVESPLEMAEVGDMESTQTSPEPTEEISPENSEEGDGQMMNMDAMESSDKKPTIPSTIVMQMINTMKEHGKHENHAKPPMKKPPQQMLSHDELLKILYKYNYTLSHHGHHEIGYKKGDRSGAYFSHGRDGIGVKVKYTANEFGYQPNITFRKLSESETPKKETEKTHNKFHGQEFKWFYRK